MRVVVTGSNGFLGRYATQQLHAGGCEVLALRRCDAAQGMPDEWRTHEFDLSTPQSLLPHDWRDTPFALLHLAWNTARPREFAAHCDHVGCLARILDYWSSRGLSKVVAIGSAEEFGQREGCLQSEDAPRGLVSAYGWGKGCARQLVENWSRATGREAVWLRPFIVYGPGQVGNMLIPYALERALCGVEADFTDGLQERDFVHVTDVAAAIALAVRQTVKGFWAVNIGSGTPTRVGDVLQHLGQQLDARHLLRLGRIQRRPTEPIVQFADVSLATKLLGWQAQISWREGIEHLCTSAREGLAWTA